jgi:hypothetical protein
MTMVRRELAVLPVAADAAAAKSRVRRFIASTDTLDSHNSKINPDGWELERFKRNPVIPLFHASRGFPIGKGLDIGVVDRKLQLGIDFAPADDPVVGADAEQALRWIDRGVMAVSVGFHPLEAQVAEDRLTGDPWEDLFNPPIDYLRQELLEVSIVAIGSNPDALPLGRELVARAAPRTRVACVAELAKLTAAAGERVLSPDELRRLVADVFKQLRADAARRRGTISGG